MYKYKQESIEKITPFVLHDIAGSLSVLRYNLSQVHEYQQTPALKSSLANAEFINEILKDWHDPGLLREINIAEIVDSVLHFCRSFLLSEKIQAQVVIVPKNLQTYPTALKRLLFNIVLLLPDLLSKQDFIFEEIAISGKVGHDNYTMSFSIPNSNLNKSSKARISNLRRTSMTQLQAGLRTKQSESRLVLELSIPLDIDPIA